MQTDGPPPSTYTPVQIARFKSIFDEFREDAEGTRLRDVPKLMRAMGANPTQAQIKELQDTAGLDEDFSLTWEVFIAMVGDRLNNVQTAEDRDAELQDMFRTLDDDGRGMLNLKELKRLLCETGDKLWPEEVEKVLQRIGKDRDSQMDFLEFGKMLDG
eukprot:TRINITY_DN19911_c0_g1_i1.p1 TRINITY_DN19911_c0_g1~~TRINITY_DN19911_c0_g1_i1.p1  ORF type:complete len:158 (-),score=39.53 TRINITY_DN19911_c0_g1_i1:291-764(-)